MFICLGCLFRVEKNSFVYMYFDLSNHQNHDVLLYLFLNLDLKDIVKVNPKQRGTFI